MQLGIRSVGSFCAVLIRTVWRASAVSSEQKVRESPAAAAAKKRSAAAWARSSSPGGFSNGPRSAIASAASAIAATSSAEAIQRRVRSLIAVEGSPHPRGMRR